MASMGDVPDVTRNKMSLCSCHKLQKNALFVFKTVNIAPFSRESLIVFREISYACRGPTQCRNIFFSSFSKLSIVYRCPTRKHKKANLS